MDKQEEVEELALLMLEDDGAHRARIGIFRNYAMTVINNGYSKSTPPARNLVPLDSMGLWKIVYAVSHKVLGGPSVLANKSIEIADKVVTELGGDVSFIGSGQRQIPSQKDEK